MANVLVVGVATVDVVMTVDSYPVEDAKIRAAGFRKTRGGNAANTAVVLSQLGHRCAWAGSLSDDADGHFIQHDLQQYGIDVQPWWQSQGQVPVSYILNSAASGSRTIVHYRDLAEYGFDAFKSLDLRQWDWLHFEGRACDQTEAMMAWIAGHHEHVTISLEVEKHRPGIERLFAYADHLLFSRGYAHHHGCTAVELLSHWHHRLPHTTMTCTWGDKGAFGVSPGSENRPIHQDAAPLKQVVDSIGAGDTFNAAMIHCRSQNQSLPDAMAFSQRLAAAKCAQMGFKHLVN